MPGDLFVVSCEHGGNRIPRAWSDLFRGREDELASHRGWDPGALSLATLLARELHATLHAVTVSRLLVDTNRREGHPRLVGDPVRKLPRAERERIVAEYHRPHRTAVLDEVRSIVAGGSRAIHLSTHTFTPVLDGVPRTTEIGLLYDPGHGDERRFGARWADALRRLHPGLRVHRNRPYRGTNDGLTSWIRERLPAALYLGFEIEVRRDLLIPRSARPTGKYGTPDRRDLEDVARLVLDGLAVACRPEVR